jgi:hypothetical protein
MPSNPPQSSPSRVARKPLPPGHLVSPGHAHSAAGVQRGPPPSSTLQTSLPTNPARQRNPSALPNAPADMAWHSSPPGPSPYVQQSAVPVWTQSGPHPTPTRNVAQRVPSSGPQAKPSPHVRPDPSSGPSADTALLSPSSRPPTKTGHPRLTPDSLSRPAQPSTSSSHPSGPSTKGTMTTKAEPAPSSVVKKSTKPHPQPSSSSIPVTKPAKPNTASAGPPGTRPSLAPTVPGASARTLQPGIASEHLPGPSLGFSSGAPAHKARPTVTFERPAGQPPGRPPAADTPTENAPFGHPTRLLPGPSAAASWPGAPSGHLSNSQRGMPATTLAHTSKPTATSEHPVSLRPGHPSAALNPT